MATDTLEKVRKEWAEKKLIARGDNVEVFKVQRIPTGVMAFDIATKGGIPESRMIEFYGARSSGKSTMALRVINNYMKKYPGDTPVYLDFEQTYDSVWASNFIEDTSKLDVVIPDYGEQGVEALLDYAKLPECNLVVLDSLAAMVPRGIIMTKEGGDKKIEEETMGMLPKLVNKMIRHVSPIMSVKRKSGKNLTLLVINQTQANVGAFGAAVNIPVKPGGQMKEFMYSMIVRHYLVSVSKDLSTWTFQMAFDKDKTGGAARRKVQYTQFQSPKDGYKIGELDEIPFLEKASKDLNLAVRSGNKWTCLGREFKTLEEFKGVLKEDQEYFNLLKAEAIRAGSGVGYGSESSD